MRIDLHTHSSVSDGTEPPREVLLSAAAAGLDVVALTDHDTTLGWAEAENAVSDTGVALVRGIEISTARYGRSVHLLGYLVNPDDPELTAELEQARDSRLRRMDRMVERLEADGIPISIDDVYAQLEEGATLGRPHLADALIAAGVVPDRAVAFRDYLHNDSPYYVSHYAVDPVRAVELVNAAGGVAVIAHPFTRTRGRTTTEGLIEEMAAAGLAGVEANHRDHGPQEVALALQVADRLGLVVTGSSDYHGDGKVNRLGENTTDPRVLEQLEERARLPVIRP
ncbi:MAG: PHP domain-containing protein [Phycicoccus sp.]|nr:PHP domain-containing protein [Phycicoccus sp.]